jgi:hypothetical protein
MNYYFYKKIYGSLSSYLLYLLIFVQKKEYMKHKVPYETYLLAALLIFLSLGAIYGGISLVFDSSGENLHLKIDNYFNYPFKDFMVPGVFLFIVFGILPLLLIYPLFTKPKLPWANAFNIYRKRHWAWTYPVYIGIILVIWIDLQILMIGYYHFIQILFSLLGLSIIVISLLPKHMGFYAKKHSSHSKYSEDHEEDQIPGM